MIISGNSQIDKVYYSGYTITKIYSCGGSLVWEMTPTPPTGDKCQLIYDDRNPKSFECNGDPELGHSFSEAIPSAGKSHLTAVTVGNCVESIYQSYFSGIESIKEVTLPSSLKSVGDAVFGQCTGLSALTIPDGVTTIGHSAFAFCANLESIHLPNSLSAITNNMLAQCYKLASISIPSGVTTIGNNSFGICSGLTSMNIPDSVTSIGNSAFTSCIGLTALTIGSGITSIGASAFEGCRGLSSITINSETVPTLGLNAFDNTNNCDIFVPCSSVEDYKAATNWATYATRIKPIAGTCETIYRWVDLDPTVDYYCSGIAKQYKQKKQESTDGGETWTDVSPAEYQRGDIVEYISSDCGYYSTGRINFMENMTTNSSTTTCITSFTVVNSSKSLCNFDISGDTVCGMRGISGGYVRRRVRSVAFPNNTKTIEANAFTKNEDYDSNKKKFLLFNEGLETIGDFAFSEFVGGDVDDSMLGVLIIPSTVTYIGHDAFNFDGTAFSSGSKNGWLHIYFKGTTPPTMANDLFGGIGETQMNSQIILYVPQGTLQAYTDALPANYKIASNPMSIVEYTESGYPYENDMYSLYLQLQSQGFLSN